MVLYSFFRHLSNCARKFCAKKKGRVPFQQLLQLLLVYERFKCDPVFKKLKTFLQ
jgi:hypothetical protein